MDPRRTVGSLAGLIVTAMGAYGLLAPDRFLGAVRSMQEPPGLYLAMVLRLAVGAALLWSASRSRAPRLLMVLGAVITIGGLLTPFLGARMGQGILDWSSTGGDGVVRAWGLFAMALGAAILYAYSGRRAATA